MQWSMPAGHYDLTCRAEPARLRLARRSSAIDRCAHDGAATRAVLFCRVRTSRRSRSASRAAPIIPNGGCPPGRRTVVNCRDVSPQIGDRLAGRAVDDRDPDVATCRSPEDQSVLMERQFDLLWLIGVEGDGQMVAGP